MFSAVLPLNTLFAVITHVMKSRPVPPPTSRPLPALLIASGILATSLLPSVRAQDDVEGLYFKGSELAQAGDFAGASEAFGKLFGDFGATLCEDYGVSSGGMYYDYGMVLMQLGKWEDARTAFKTCNEWSQTCKGGSKKDQAGGINRRENLALFQWGYCEAQTDNFVEALKLYDRYLNSKPSAEELQKLRNDYKLRVGTAKLRLGQVEEGAAIILELFTNKDAWSVNQGYLTQGFFELGLGWIAAAEKNPAIVDTALTFLDQNDGVLQMRPFEAYRSGFYDRVKKLGYDSIQAELPLLALRFFALAPTVADVVSDTKSRIPPGAQPPAPIQEMLKTLEEKLGSPENPDVDVLRLVARAYDRLGNRTACRAIYSTLADQYPNLETDRRAEVLHEAARFSSLIQDYSAAEYYGQMFIKELPDHKLRPNVEVFMLMSLFTSQQFEKVLEVAQRIRGELKPGDDGRELADALYPMALFSLQRFADAEPEFDLYAKSYKGTSNEEMVRYHRATNKLVLKKSRDAADMLDDFLKTYPDSPRFVDLALGDLAAARFNLDDYDSSISAVDLLLLKRPESRVLDRALNIKADCLMLKAQTAKEDADAEKFTQEALQAHLQAIEVGQKLESNEKDERNIAVHKEYVSEALAKCADIYVTQEKWEDAAKMYDLFVKDYRGTYWEPQISVFTLDALKQVGRAEEGLTQVEKMIFVLGTKAPEEMDLELLRRCLGSYGTVSVEIRGLEKTIENLKNFPQVEKEHVILRTWLMMQQVIVLQEAQGKAKKESPEYVAMQKQIDEAFTALQTFKVNELAEPALRAIGEYLANSSNPFLAVPYLEELLVRTTESAETYQGTAHYFLGTIALRKNDKDSWSKARDHFNRVIEIKDPKYADLALLNLGRAFVKLDDWPSAKTTFEKINNSTKMFIKEKQLRAEANFTFGLALEKTGDLANALKAYTGVWGAYQGYPEWASQSTEKIINIQLEESKKMTGMELRKQQLQLFTFLKTTLYTWQKWKDDDDPTGTLIRVRQKLPVLRIELNITPEEEKNIDIKNGLTAEPEK